MTVPVCSLVMNSFATAKPAFNVSLVGLTEVEVADMFHVIEPVLKQRYPGHYPTKLTAIPEYKFSPR